MTIHSSSDHGYQMPVPCSVCQSYETPCLCAPAVDLRIENHGSVCMLRPLSEAAIEWLHEHLDEGALWYGSAAACEPRFVQAIIDGAEGDGLSVGVS